jgi:hypothetical protein
LIFDGILQEPGDRLVLIVAFLKHTEATPNGDRRRSSR